MVSRTIGLREHWYFDLEHQDRNNDRFWLKRHKKVSNMRLPKPGNSVIITKLRVLKSVSISRLLRMN